MLFLLECCLGVDVFISVDGRRVLAGVIIIANLSLIAGPANAQTLLRGPGAAALDPMFRKVLQNPSEVDLNLAFARRAIELEDFEAAVATLERLLIGRSGLPLIRLELGMLYLRLKAPELAEAYLLQVLEATGVDPKARERAEILLEQTRKANAKGSFAMSLSLGTKHASNAVTRPTLANLIAYNDLQQEANPAIPDLELDTAETDKPDSGAATTGSISVSYSRELDGLTERRFNASLNQYTSQQNDKELASLDIEVTSLRMGVTLPLARNGKPPLTLSPYISANSLNTSTVDAYAVTGAVGMSVNGYAGARNPIAVSFELADKTHELAIDAPKDGGRYNIGVTLGHIHSHGGYTSLAFKIDETDAGTDYESSTGAVLNASYSQTWRGTRFGAGLGYKENKEGGIRPANPVIEKIRRDKDLTASLSLQRSFFGISADFAVNYIDRDSNIPKSRYDDLTGSLTFSRSFQ
tara:strand:+ start:1937 stop:3340 length:1404 start_codon:yes stop_codon:yes gene_type:complete